MITKLSELFDEYNGLIKLNIPVVLRPEKNKKITLHECNYMQLKDITNLFLSFSNLLLRFCIFIL